MPRHPGRCSDHTRLHLIGQCRVESDVIYRQTRGRRDQCGRRADFAVTPLEIADRRQHTARTAGDRGDGGCHPYSMIGNPLRQSRHYPTNATHHTQRIPLQSQARIALEPVRLLFEEEVSGPVLLKCFNPQFSKQRRHPGLALPNPGGPQVVSRQSPGLDLASHRIAGQNPATQAGAAFEHKTITARRGQCHGGMQTTQPPTNHQKLSLA